MTLNYTTKNAPVVKRRLKPPEGGNYAIKTPNQDGRKNSIPNLHHTRAKGYA